MPLTPRFLTISAFLVMILFSWANEVFDLPHLLLSAPETPVNWRESVIETVFLVIGGILFYRMAGLYEEKLRKHLTGLHTICSYCHAVKDRGRWLQLEDWLKLKSDAEMSHGLCWKCLKERHPDLYLKKLNAGLVPPEEKDSSE